MEANKIIITGGATRIGAAIANKLSGPGIEIVIHYNKSKSNAEKLKKKLSKNLTKVYLIKGDLSKENDLKKIVKFCKKKLKYFDCLINNASLFESDKLENAGDLLSLMSVFEEGRELKHLYKFNELLIDLMEQIQDQNKKNRLFVNKALHSLEQIREEVLGTKKYSTYGPNMIKNNVSLEVVKD